MAVLAWAPRLLSPSGIDASLSILILHRVLAVEDPIFPDEMHAARFERTLGWIKEAFQVLALPDAVSRLRAATLPKNALCITFDDGYEDNCSVALPLLQKHGLTASFFVATGFLDGGRMWNDTVIETVRRAAPGSFDAGTFGNYELSDADSRRQAIEALIGRIKYLDLDARLAAVDALAAEASVELPVNLMMRGEQVRKLHGAGMAIGAHTRSHPILATLPTAQATSEISEGRRELEEIIGDRVALFAYPNGRPQRDYVHEHVEIVRELGFDAAVTTAWGASRHGDDLFQLRRFSPWDTSRTRYTLRLLRNLRENQRHPLV